MSSDSGLVGDNPHWSIAFLSIARLDRYLRRHKGSFDRALEEYATDLKALGELMILINLSEVAIRNSVVFALQRRYGNGDLPWYEAIEDLLTRKKSIQETKKRIRSEGRTVSSATVTAGMTLGFWVSLFGANYEPTLWTKALRNVFTGESTLNRGIVHRRLTHLLKIRNVAAHHGLVSREDSEAQKEHLLTLILWVSPEGHAWARKNIKP
jgi:hypothetical protein